MLSTCHLGMLIGSPSILSGDLFLDNFAVPSEYHLKPKPKTLDLLGIRFPPRAARLETRVKARGCPWFRGLGLRGSGFRD